jgi:predicted flap endonuclease-1-like 5' DNA nuclease
MHREDAVAAGLLEPKRRERPEDKMRRSSGDKAQGKGDDLTEIPGIGAATADQLEELGFWTLDQLREADLDELPSRARQAVEEWRDAKGRDAV